MISHTNSDSIQSYKGKLGDELHKFLLGLWELRESVPEIEAENFSLTAEEFSLVFVPMLRFIAVSEQSFVDLAQRLEEEVLPQLDDSDVENLLFVPQELAEFLSSKLEAESELSADQWVTLNMAVVSALSPFAIQVAQTKELLEDVSCEDGSCPICGQAAEMGILIDSGADTQGSSRKLWCSFCETQWDYDRIRCTRCGTRSQEELTYHFDEGDAGRRIYFCSKCEGTQKILCEKELEGLDELDLRLESILMSGLEHAVSEHCLTKKVAKSN